MYIEEDSVSIEFPCEYPVKVMGRNTDDFSDVILDIIRRHAPDLRDENISFRPSRNKNYLAVNVIIYATGVQQLQALFDDLKASGRVSMVL
ncbi:MAG: YbeD family protein [Pseudohongiellaceae bacterium]